MSVGGNLFQMCSEPRQTAGIRAVVHTTLNIMIIQKLDFYRLLRDHLYIRLDLHNTKLDLLHQLAP